MKLSRYVIKTAFLAMAGGVLGLWLLQAVFAYLSELENLSDSYTALNALWYTVYRLPYFFVQFVGTGVLLGAVVGLGLLSGNSEIVVMRAAGISLYRIIGWTMLPAFVFVGLSLTINEVVLPHSQQLAKTIKNPHDNALILNEFWTVIPNESGQHIINIGTADSQGNLANIRKFETAQSELTTLFYAPTGKHQAGYSWQVDNAEQVKIGAMVVNQSLDSTTIELPINRQAVQLLTKPADDLSISELYAHRQLMTHQQNRSKRHELAFWQKLLSPFAVLSLLLVACSFVFGSLRSQSLGLRVVMALLTGLLFSYLTDLTGFIALATTVSPLPMVLLPIVATAMIGLYLLAKKG